MTDPLPLQPERLLEHAGWVRSLARRLTRDANVAEDLAQETLAAAIEHPPGRERHLRRWLAAVLRNFARQRHRGEARRLAREAATARSEALPSTADLVDRLTAQRNVAEVVVDLEEPYRTTILLRFYEGLPPRVIARRQGVPVETVKTRIQRGLARLRFRLDRTYEGDRRAWLLALVPLWKPSLLAAPTAVGTAIVNAKGKAAVVASLVLAPIAVWVALPDREEPSVPVAASLSEAPIVAPEKPGATSEAPSPEPARRTELQASAPATPPEPEATREEKPPAATEPGIRGRVLDEIGRPLAGVRVEVVGAGEGGPRATSAADGRFELEAPDRSGRIHAVDPVFTTVLAGMYGNLGATDPVVVVAPRVSIEGRVVDEEGAPLPGARGRVEIPEAFRTRFHEILDSSAEVARGFETGADGIFSLPDTPQLEGTRLRIGCDGFVPHEEPVPASDAFVTIVLQRPSGDRHVRGLVVGPDGRPVERARVALGMNTTRSDKKGEFVFPLDDPGSFNARLELVPTTLVAVKAGLLPARFDAPLAADGAPVWPARVTLRLGGTPLAITGKVVDPRGEPLEGMSVWLVDPTLFGRLEGGLGQVENLLAGVEGVTWHSVETSELGLFRIDGLLPREYRVRAMDPATLLRTEEGPFAAGTEDILLRMPSDGLYDRVAGRILSRSGKPVPEADVFPMCDTFRTEVREGVANTNHASVEGTETDAEGRFELKRVPKNLVYLRIEGENLIPLEYGRFGVLPVDRIERLEITVDLRCHFKVELADPASADELSVLDEAGKELILNIFIGNGRRENERAPIGEGLSDTIAVSDAGETLVLHLRGEEVSRSPLPLEPGKLTAIRR